MMYIQILLERSHVIDQVAPMKKEVRVKNNLQDWFDAEIHKEMEMRDKLLDKFKKSRRSTDHENNKKQATVYNT